MKNLQNLLTQWIIFFVVCFGCTVNNLQALDSHSPVISLDGSGNAIALFLTIDENGAYFVQSTTYSSATNSWSAPVTISTNPLINSLPHLVVNANGEAVAVWTAIDENTYMPVVVGSIYSGGTWGADVVLSSNNNHSYTNANQLVLDEAGNFKIVYTSLTSSSAHVEVVDGTISGGFNSPIVISS